MLNFLARNLDALLATYGYLAVFVFVGVESIGIPVPGETMLVTAAIYAGTTGRLSIFWVILASAAGAIWSPLYGVAPYLLGQQLLRLSGPIDLALAIVGVVVIIGAIVFLRRNEARLQREADAAMLLERRS